MIKEPPRQSALSLLSPDVFYKAKAFYKDINQREEVKRAGIEAYALETLRSKDRQKWLYGKGRTINVVGKYANPGVPIVTWTLFSNHMLGLAFDTAFRKNGQYTNKVPKNVWRLVVEVGKKYGLNSLAPREYTHLEANFDVSYGRLDFMIDFGLIGKLIRAFGWEKIKKRFFS